VDDLPKVVTWLTEQVLHLGPGGIRNCAAGDDVTPFLHPSGASLAQPANGLLGSVGPDTFRVQFDRIGFSRDCWLLADHPGDARYHRAVQADLVSLRRRITQGQPRSITLQTAS
jgi:hypothetical protein